MRMQRFIAVLALAVGFFAAPTLGAVAMDVCPPCCPQPADAPCETGEAPCVSLSVASCCDAAPAAPASEAKRQVDAPSLHAVATTARFGSPVPRIPTSSRAGADLVLLTSPLRLSVVLLI